MPIVPPFLVPLTESTELVLKATTCLSQPDFDFCISEVRLPFGFLEWVKGF